MPVTSVLHYVTLFALVTFLIFLLTLTFKFLEYLVGECQRKQEYSKVASNRDLEVGLISSVICDKHEYPSLPLELWFQILEHVDNPQDFLSCINTFPVWNRVLSHRKTKELLSLVFPHFEKYLDTPSLLQCRLVSTKWKSIVDDVLQQQDEENPNKAKTYSPGNFMGSRSRAVWNKISSIEDLQKFNSEMEHFLPSNPFPSRNLQISVSPLDFDADDDLIDYYATLVTEFVTNFGYHLHKLNYTMKVYEPSALFPRILHFLPNLQQMTFTIPFLCTANYAEVVGQDYEHRMASMPCLKSFHLNTPEGQQLVPIILNAFLQNYGDRLETLSSLGGAFGSFERDENSSLLPNCKNLTVALVDDDTCCRLFAEPRFTWNLRRLCLLFPRQIDSNLQGGKVKLESILRGINPVAATLTELQLCLNWKLKEWGTPLYLEERKEEASGILRYISKFPKLKTLVISDDLMEVAIVQQLVQDNFVGLERFVIDMGIYDEYFRGRRMYEDEENPLWGLRPTLKIIERVSLTVRDGIVEIQQIKQCSRDQYEFRRRKSKIGDSKRRKFTRVQAGSTVSRVMNIF